MTKNPFINAGAAAIYIGAVVLFISTLGHIEGEDTLLAPLLFISMLVLSVLVMSYCFFFTPIQQYLDGHKKEAVSLLGKSVAYFAGFVLIVIAAALFVMLK